MKTYTKIVIINPPLVLHWLYILMECVAGVILVNLTI